MIARRTTLLGSPVRFIFGPFALNQLHTGYGSMGLRENVGWITLSAAYREGFRQCEYGPASVCRQSNAMVSIRCDSSMT